jgi:putative Mg2+ transporter-C (MgtC) family protein
MNEIYLSEIDMLIRLCLGFLAGTIIGLERSSRHQVAGLRTHILIAVGATLLMLLSIWLPQEFSSLKNGDPGRIAAQVVSGIGFLGAGAMIRLGNNIKGLTTAASLWISAAFGLAIGAGMFLAAGIALALTMFSLIVLGRFEQRFFPSERNKVLEITYNDNPDREKTLELLRSFNIRVQSVDMEQVKGKAIKLRLLIAIPDSADSHQIIKTLKTTGKVARIEIKEKY